MVITGEMNELKIVFIYDRFSCRREEDDPKDAILYFHPETICIDKRVAICGQLMGVSHFFTDTFSAPRILTLGNGKFAMRHFDDQYILAIGCSSNTSDFLLEKEADILLSVIKFFHCDMKSILRNSDFDRGIVATKLMSMMDHYIPLSQQHGDLFSLTFGILPILHLPKSANNISMQASILLQTCMLKAGVLGGIVMYQNKVVGVELCQSLAQKLAFTQPYRMPPADQVKLEFVLPIGVQIFRVYITDAEFEGLRCDCSKFQNKQGYTERVPLKSKKDKNGMNTLTNPIEEELSSKGGAEDSDVSSGIHSDETGRHNFHHNKSLRRDNLKLSDTYGDTRGTKPKPRRCQSVVDLHYDLEFGPHNGSDSSLPMKNSDLRKKLGASVADPTFPYFSANGRLSVSSAFHNSPESGGDEDDHRTRQDRLDSNESSQEYDRNQHPVLKPVMETSTPVSIRRPADLPLTQHKLTGPQRIKKKLWATFNELLSPEPEPAIDNLVNGSATSKINQSDNSQTSILHGDNEVNFQKGSVKPAIKIPESIHLRLLNSFRRLSSHDEVLDESGDGDGEYSNSSSFSACISTYSETENVQMVSASSSSLSQSSSLFSPVKILHASGLKLNKAQVSTSRKNRPAKVNELNDSYIPRKEVALYIYYDGSMRLLLLLDKKDETNQELIESIWEYVSSSLIQLKASLTSIEEQSSFSNQSDPYCFLRYESVWKSMAHGGRNESMDFNTVQIMHRDFTRHPNINELIIRGDDHVVYGYQCVGSEVYYQQRAGLQPGLPMPSDLMGKVPLKAKRRLERDHSIFLL